MAEVARTTHLGERHESPHGVLVEPILLAPDLEAPGLEGVRAVAELRQGSVQLRGPAEGVDARLCFPHRTPRGGRLALPGLVLEEMGTRFGRAPGRLVQPAVERDRPG